jgi:spore coat protein A
MDGVLGGTILVNGAPWPVLEVSNTRYRFRILNASNARRYELALQPGNAPFVQVGSDGGLLGAPIPHRTISMAQAERLDVVVDFSKYDVGDEVTLKNRMSEDRTADVMRFRVTNTENDMSSRNPTPTARACFALPGSATREERCGRSTAKRSTRGTWPPVRS